MGLQTLREEVCRVNRCLVSMGLVVMHSGNASGYDRASGRLVIKPSGIDYDALTPEDLVEVDVATGRVVDGRLRPSVDLPHHLYLYRHLPEVCGIVHTHSNHATAFAACQKPIPLVLTAIADEFGKEIPCTPYVDNQGEAIGRAIIKHHQGAPAVLLGNHGLFAWNRSPTAALKTAAMVEDVAKTVILSSQVGRPVEIPVSEAAKWYDRYQNRYGQQTAVLSTLPALQPGASDDQDQTEPDRQAA